MGAGVCANMGVVMAGWRVGRRIPEYRPTFLPLGSLSRAPFLTLTRQHHIHPLTMSLQEAPNDLKGRLCLLRK